jgi:hypothetical protein
MSVSSTTLIVEAIIALVTLAAKHQDAKAVGEAEIEAALHKAFEEFKLRDPDDLPDV